MMGVGDSSVKKKGRVKVHPIAASKAIQIPKTLVGLRTLRTAVRPSLQPHA